GGTPREALETVIGKVELHPIAVAEKRLPVEKARSPGMRHRHYAPKAKLVVVEGELPAIIQKVMELVNNYKKQKMKVGVLATDETVNFYKADVVKSLGSRNHLDVVAKNLFGLLREFDVKGVNVIIAEGVPTEGLGLAVMNRLRKASGYRIVKASL
ncbi:MAG: Sua5 family C-terminal domain-containing protein, partial [Candidatus Bathyarchaeia archaeon]